MGVDFVEVDGDTEGDEVLAADAGAGPVGGAVDCWGDEVEEVVIELSTEYNRNIISKYIVLLIGHEPLRCNQNLIQPLHLPDILARHNLPRIRQLPNSIQYLFYHPC